MSKCIAGDTDHGTAQAPEAVLRMWVGALREARTWLVFGKRGSIGAVFGSLAMSASLIAVIDSSSPMVLAVAAAIQNTPVSRGHMAEGLR